MTAAKTKALAKPKPRTKKQLAEIAKKVVHAPLPKGAKWTGDAEDTVLRKLAVADKAKLGTPSLDLVKSIYGPDVAKAAFTVAPGAQQTLPRKPPSGPELTTEICNLEQKIRKTKSELVDAFIAEKAAKKHREGREAELAKLRDALEECVYDLRSGQGRISFPKQAAEPKNGPASS